MVRSRKCSGWVLVPVFTISRLLGKRLGLSVALRSSHLRLDSDQKLAMSVAPIGRLAIAIVVNAQLLYPGGSISPIVASVIAWRRVNRAHRAARESAGLQ